MGLFARNPHGEGKEMDRKELLEMRREVFDEYSERKRLGEFDTNAKSITLNLKATIEVIDHLLEELKQSKKK